MKKIRAAQIKGSHGVKGFFKLRVFLEDPASLAQYNPLYLSENGDDTITIKLKNQMKDLYLAESPFFTSPEAIKPYNGNYLYVDASALPQMDNTDTFYVHDLIGIHVLNEDGKKIGKVKNVDNFGAGDLLEIMLDTGDTFYLTFTKQNVPTINLDTGTITINRPEEI